MSIDTDDVSTALVTGTARFFEETRGLVAEIRVGAEVSAEASSTAAELSGSQ